MPERLTTSRSVPIWARYSDSQRTFASSNVAGSVSRSGRFMASSSSVTGGAQATSGLADERGNVVERASRMEDARHARFQQHRLVIVGNDAADDDDDVVESRAAQGGHELRNDQVIGRKGGNADHVDVFLARELDYGGDLLPRRRVDDLHAGVAQVRGDDAAAAIVTVEADLGDEDLRGDVHASSQESRSNRTKLRAIPAGESRPARYQVCDQFSAPSSISLSARRSVGRGSGSAFTACANVRSYPSRSAVSSRATSGTS